ncbi:succinic semialdehyde dehydrogenase [Myceligenerans pegani]|uniref:Succinate-semialdehyde dehydrogenase (NADP(+)) n=1 Tax=Myceligenerans pegani TaxID=2776917 RepID=A0ABR9MTR3_9MICO|nr:succinic semialdehyde dehydrogenase [Myceligenerans sp. TRM 65318]MBE1874344.1 succinate-semialdehyde dehydrogenase (NADP(+)) [Myceligenerans sp. TRM 65318]MBE3016615.1 succinate-semialdehyde dehydrogenase (NADP(+)) [Myceligenerans sp. TRM 65318]
MIDETPGEAAVGSVFDPESPESTYVLEPELVAPLVARVASSQGAGTHRSTCPFTGGPLATIPVSSPADVAAAVERGRLAQRAWERTGLADRSRVLDNLARIVLVRQSEVLDLIQLETGKARRSAFEEVGDVAQVARHYAVKARRYLATDRPAGMIPLVTGVRVQRRPVGVVGAITPWNYPLTLVLSEALPALVAGNAVVVKPDPQTTLTALWAAEVLEEAGLPAGLFQIVAGGRETGEELVDRADHVAFTGSTAVGRKVAARAGERLVGATLELGGKNAIYIADDVDVTAALPGVVRACFASTGQLCLSAERIVVHEAVADEFVAKLVRDVRNLRLGAGLDYTVDVGSLTSDAQLAKVTEHVDDALARGAVVLAGGVHRSDLGPYFYAPTVLDDVPSDALVAREETFGPVVSVTRVRSDDEAVAVMNDSEYGLHMSVWSGDTARARKVADQIEAGSVSINDGYMLTWGSVGAPTGGWKASGLGRRHGRSSVEAMTQTRTIVTARGAGRGLGIEAVLALEGAAPSRILSAALEGMRKLRIP